MFNKLVGRGIKLLYEDISGHPKVVRGVLKSASELFVEVTTESGSVFCIKTASVLRINTIEDGGFHA